MADVNVDFAARDQGVGKTIDDLQTRLKGFEGGVSGFTGRVGEMAASFGRMIGPIIAAGAAFLGARSAVQSFTDAINVAGKLNDLSARTGETAGELAVLQRAFENAGSSADAVGPMLNRLQRFMIEASEGGKSQIEAMQKLGLSYDELKAKTPSEQLQALASAISKVEDPAQRSALAMAIFGRGGGEMMPLLRAMTEELDTARAQLGSYPDVINRSAASLDAIGDNFAALTTKAREFVTGALVNIAPELARITDEVAKVDFTAMGQRFADAMQNAYDFFRGLFANPMDIFSLYGDYLEAQMRLAGDMLITAFRTSFDFFVNAWQALMDNNAFGRFAEVLADAFMYGVARLNLALLNVIEGVLAFWGQLWGSVTQGGISGFAEKLFNLVKFFASDFAQALTNPIGFFAGKLTSALLGSAQEGAKAYQFSWDAATGSIIEKTRAGLQGAVDATGGRLRESGGSFGSALSSSLEQAVSRTQVVKSNFFGSNEAMQQVADSAAKIAERGRTFRENSASAATSISKAKGDVSAAVDLTTGPAGIATATKEAAGRTSAASKDMSAAFNSVGKAAGNINTSLEKAGNTFGRLAVEAGRTFKQEILGAMGGLTSSMRGFATEATLKDAVKELKSLAKKLPQPVLV